MALASGLSGPSRARGEPAIAPPGGFLPDSTVLIRVGDRVVRARDFVETYFNSWPEFRPPADSAGRVAFLGRIADKEVMATVALRVNRPLGFEDRLTLRQYTRTMLANTLYRRLVLDSVQVTEADIEALLRQYSCEKNLKRIVFEDLPTAERVRGDLLAKRITWKQAQHRYSKAVGDVGPEGDLGWLPRTRFTADDAVRIFDLEPGQISLPHRVGGGVEIVWVTARRPKDPPQFTRYPRILRKEIRETLKSQRMARIQARLGQQVGLIHNEANIEWAAKSFPTPPPLMDSTGVMQLRRITNLPRFAPEDTGRVLCRWSGGQLSLAGFMREYTQTNSFLRTPVNTPDLLRSMADVFALEPLRVQLAIDLGLERDPWLTAETDLKREEMLVDHLYQDSVASRVWVAPAEHRKYYDQHIAQFITYPTVRFAGISAGTKRRADSLAARLRLGEHAQDLLRADSIRYGHAVGAISQVTSEDQGHTFYKLLFEELKPGQVAVEPDERRGYWVVQSLAFDPGRQLSFEESQSPIAQSLENMAAEKLLNAFLDRHKRQLRIETHPELVMRIEFTQDKLSEE
jgi:hypothetical protein